MDLQIQKVKKLLGDNLNYQYMRAIILIF